MIAGIFGFASPMEVLSGRIARPRKLRPRSSSANFPFRGAVKNMLIKYQPEKESYFTLLDYCLKAGLKRADFRCERPWTVEIRQMDLFACAETPAEYGTASIAIHSNKDAALAFISAMERAASGSSEEILFAFLSEEAIESSIIAFAEFAITGSRSILRDETDPDIRTVLRAARRVRKEIHAFQGILRFEETEPGFFEAKFEPDADIAAALLPFFEARFGVLPFRIIDMKRGRIVGAQKPAIRAARTENGECVDLWKTFYASTENPQRFNPKLRLQHIPKRYWKYIPELEGKN